MSPLILGTILLLLLLPVPGQVADGLRVFDPVPVNQRSHLNERLKLFVDYHRTKRYAELFEMLPKVHTQHPELTKEKFLAQIKMQRKAHVVGFLPTYTIENRTIDGEYAINGCAKVREGVSGRRWQATVLASLENGEWYFSDILFTFSSLHASDPAACTSNK